MSPFHDLPFHVRVPAHVELNAFALHMSSKGLFKNSFPQSVCTQTGRLRIGLDLGSLTLQCGMKSAARHSENISCSGVTSAARHGARSHSFVYISTTSVANVIGLLRACS